MESSEVLALVKNRFEGVSVQLAYAETTFFYNPNLHLPKGVYFLTIKEKDGQKMSHSTMPAVVSF